MAGRMPPEVAASSWVSSWAPRARHGDPTDPDFGRRVGAWAQWTLERLTVMTGVADRRYPAFTLPGEFFQASSPLLPARPHVEVPAKVMAGADPGFPVRLAAAGNGVLFSSWLPAEVIAFKRALFSAGPSDPSEVVAALVASRAGLVDRLGVLSAMLGRRWAGLEAALVADPEPVSAAVVEGFSAEQTAALVPALEPWGVTVVFDEKLAAAAGPRAARRVGVWQVLASDGLVEVSFPVVTPRLTRWSLFSDPLFVPVNEGPGALLVRCLLLARLAREKVGPVGVAAEPVKGFRVMPAVAGKALPEASVAAATAFVQAFADPVAAWEAMSGWAARRPAPLLLTVSKEGFVPAFRACARAVRRAVVPAREDINVLLPVAWEDNRRVVRVTFGHAAGK